jgi:hypothetical protein
MLKLHSRLSFIALALLLTAIYLSAQKKAAPKPQAAPVEVKTALLPDVFDGWELKGTIKPFAKPEQADPANAAALTEYGFTDGATATYTRGNLTLDIRALRFVDATGTYGAYSFYRQSGWPKEQIGTGGASDKNRALFWQGNLFIDANFSQLDPAAAGSLRELAKHLPTISGTKAIAPPVLANLPQKYLDGQTTHYALGAAGYQNGVLPASLVGFDRGAEVVTATYTLTTGKATLTLIDYPTPQMAAAQETAIHNYILAGDTAQAPWTAALKDSIRGSLEVRRSGPIVALVSGSALPDDSHHLVETVHFDAALVSIPQPVSNDVQKTVELLTGIGVIVGVGSLAAVLLAFFLGGFRALWRVARGKPASSLYDAEFIHIDLREDPPTKNEP